MSASNRQNQLNNIVPEVSTFEMPIITRDAYQLNKLANSFVDFRGYLFFYRGDIMHIKNNAIKLVDMIPAEYKIK